MCQSLTLVKICSYLKFLLDRSRRHFCFIFLCFSFRVLLLSIHLLLLSLNSPSQETGFWGFDYHTQVENSYQLKQCLRADIFYMLRYLY
jgi:hypothetical protein